MRKRIALFYPWIYLTSGAERTILELTGRSRHHWTLFTNHFDAASSFPEFCERDVVELKRVSVKRALGSAAVAALQVMTQRLPLADFEALVVVSEGFGDLVVFRNRKRPILCICLTPLRPVFDPLYRDRARRMRGFVAGFTLTVASAVYRIVDRWAWRKYARVFCISDEVKQRAIQGNLRSAADLEVQHVGLGVRDPEPSDRFEPFFLVPGRIMWTKNLELAIHSFRRFRQIAPDLSHFRLTIAGIVDAKSRPYLNRLRRMAAGDEGIEFRVFPSDRELADLYRRCYAVLFTAFNEDWGIVPLEGLAFGKPAIATNRGGPRESIRHGITGFLEEADAEAFALRMAELARNEPRARAMGRAGFDDVQRYSWDHFAAAIDNAIDEITLHPAIERRPGRPIWAKADGRRG